jgi:hypothetical protein
MRAALTIVVCALPWASSQAATSFDGRYSGQRTVVRGSAPICPKDGRATWRISDGRLTFKFWTVNLPLEIAPDGTFKGATQYSPSHGRTSWLRVQGAISGDGLQADAESRACQMHYSLARI